MTIIRVAQNKPEHMTKLALRNRFTFEERVAIETAAESDPAVRVFLADLNVSTFIDRFDVSLGKGLEALEQAGLIAQGRAEEIQTARVEDHERYSS